MSGEPIHVYPVNDLCEHDTWGTDCVCGPRVEENGMLVLHHSLDGREKRERRRATRIRVALVVAAIVGAALLARYI